MKTQYMLPQHTCPDKIFIIQFSELVGRIDPIFYASDLNKFNASIYNNVCLKSVICDIRSGIGAGKQDQSNATDGIIQIRPTNIDENGLLKYDKNVYIPKSDGNIKVEMDDVLFNNTNSQDLVGKTAILKERRELSCSNHITKIKVYKNIIIPDYLWIILNIYQKNRIFYSICTNWNNQSGIGIDLLKSIKIPLPPIAIQQKIVNIHQIAHQQKQQKEAQAQALLASIDNYLLEELGIKMPIENDANDMSSYQDFELNKQNPLVKNGRLFLTGFREIAGGRLDPDYISKIHYIETLPSKYPFVRIKDILIKQPQYGANEESIDVNCQTDIRYIRITDIDEIGNLKQLEWKTAVNIEEKYLLSYNDILFARSGSVGKCYIHKETNNPAIFAGYLIRFVFNEKVNPDYVFYYCNSTVYWFWIRTIQRPAVQSNINSEEYKSLKIPLPPIEKQNKIVMHISEMRKNAKHLQIEAVNILESAKQKVEQLILGE